MRDELKRWLQRERRGHFDEQSDQVSLTLSGQRAVVELGDETQLRLTVSFEPPLSCELEVRTLVDDDYWEFFSNPEITFDEEAFDEALVVRGDSEYRVSQLLTPTVRDALLSLHHSVAQLRLTRDALVTVLKLAPTYRSERPESQLNQAMLSLEQLTRLLCGEQRELRGPYR